jgi:hypothetical protein
VRKALAAVASAAAMMIAPAMAGVADDPHRQRNELATRAVARFEAAAGHVANGTLRAQWGSPGVRWTRAGGSMTMVMVGNLGPLASNCGAEAAACHGVLPSGEPVALVDVNQADTGVPWTVSASHELFEMLVDPLAQTTMQATDGLGRHGSRRSPTRSRITLIGSGASS